MLKVSIIRNSVFDKYSTISDENRVKKFNSLHRWWLGNSVLNEANGLNSQNVRREKKLECSQMLYYWLAYYGG